MGRTYDGRDISKTIVNIGVAGEIELSDALPSLSVVTFTAKAKVGAVKHVFRDDGTVKEQVILALDPESFEITGVKKAAEQPDLPLAAAPKLPTVKPQEKTERPLLVSCESCGHGQGDHEDGAAACRVPACQCMTFVPFPGDQGTVDPAETDQVAADMGLQREVAKHMTSCATCAHLQDSHTEGFGSCLVAGCTCTVYEAHEEQAPTDADNHSGSTEGEYEAALAEAGEREEFAPPPPPEAAPADDQIATGAVNAEQERPKRRGRGKLRAVGSR